MRDNGLGVPEDAKDKLFQRFFRAHDATITGIEGTGLGLSIVREVVEGIGGRVWIESGSDGGSVFAFGIPCRRGETRTTKTTEVRTESSEATSA